MYKNTLVFLASLLLSVMASGVSAGVITDTVDVNNWFNNWGETKSWTHDINDDGFNPASMDVTSASLTFQFTDDGGWWDGGEYARVVIDLKDTFSDWLYGTRNDFSLEVDAGNYTRNVGINGVLSLNDNGLLDVSITSRGGDFGLKSVILSADTVAVPEPGSIALLGLGLVGLGLSRRRIKA